MRRTPLTTTPRLQQVCVRPRPLPAFAVERRAAAPCYRAVSMLLLHCRNWTDRQTPDSCIDSAPHAMRAVPITTDRVSGEGNAIGRVRPSVCFHSRLTLIFCTFVNHDDSSPGIESQGHRSMWTVRVSLRLAKMATRSVRPRSWIEGNLFYSFTSAAAVFAFTAICLLVFISFFVNRLLADFYDTCGMATKLRTEVESIKFWKWVRDIFWIRVGRKCRHTATAGIHAEGGNLLCASAAVLVQRGK